MARIILTGIVLLLVSSLIAGCGIAQEQYDAVVNEQAKAQQELQSVKAELQSTQAKVSELTSNLEKSKTELGSVQAKNADLTASLGSSKAELQAANAKYDSYKSELQSLWPGKQVAVNQALLDFSGSFISKDKQTVSKAALVTAKLADQNNKELTALWEQAWVRQDDGTFRSYNTTLQAFMSKCVSRLGGKTNALKNKLFE